MSNLAQSRSGSVSLSSLDPGLQVHLSTRSIRVSTYIITEEMRVYGNPGVTQADRATGSTHSGDLREDSHHLIFISSRLTQFRGFSRLGSIISSHFLPRPLELEPFFLTNSIWMSQVVGRNIDGGLTEV